MTDRDRLAADLDAYFAESDSRNVNPDALADRLIALGWTRECEHCDPEHVWPCPTLLRCDEPGCEQQATCGHPSPNGYRRVCGPHFAAIAKAYREDTDGAE